MTISLSLIQNNLQLCREGWKTLKTFIIKLQTLYCLIETKEFFHRKRKISPTIQKHMMACKNKIFSTISFTHFVLNSYIFNCHQSMWLLYIYYVCICVREMDDSIQLPLICMYILMYFKTIKYHDEFPSLLSNLS